MTASNVPARETLPGSFVPSDLFGLVANAREADELIRRGYGPEHEVTVDVEDGPLHGIFLMSRSTTLRELRRRRLVLADLVSVSLRPGAPYLPYDGGRTYSAVALHGAEISPVVATTRKAE